MLLPQDWLRRGGNASEEGFQEVVPRRSPSVLVVLVGPMNSPAVKTLWIVVVMGWAPKWEKEYLMNFGASYFLNQCPDNKVGKLLKELLTIEECAFFFFWIAVLGGFEWEFGVRKWDRIRIKNK